MRDSRIDWVMGTAKQVQKAYEEEFGSVKARHLSPDSRSTGDSYTGGSKP